MPSAGHAAIVIASLSLAVAGTTAIATATAQATPNGTQREYRSPTPYVGDAMYTRASSIKLRTTARAAGPVTPQGCAGSPASCT